MKNYYLNFLSEHERKMKYCSKNQLISDFNKPENFVVAFKQSRSTLCVHILLYEKTSMRTKAHYKKNTTHNVMYSTYDFIRFKLIHSHRLQKTNWHSFSDLRIRVCTFPFKFNQWPKSSIFKKPDAVGASSLSWTLFLKSERKMVQYVEKVT